MQKPNMSTSLFYAPASTVEFGVKRTLL